MRRSRLVALLTGVWVVLATSVGCVLIRVPPAAAVDVCPTLFVPAGLPDVETVAPPGASLRSVQGDLNALTDRYRYDGVDREVLYIPADDGQIAWVRESGYTAGDRSDWQVVVCLGGLVPEAVSRTVDEARELVTQNRLVPVADADGSWVVSGLRPGPGQVLPFDSEVVITAQPTGVRDMAVTDIDGTVVDGERVDVEVVVQNTGDVRAGPASLFLEYAGDPLDVIEVDRLEPGESAAFSRSLPVPPQARGTTWTLVALLEYGDDDLDNNRAPLPIAPGLPDLVIEDVNVRVEADGVVVAGTVVNLGPGDAAATTLRVRLADERPMVLPVQALAGGAEQPFFEKLPVDGGPREIEVEARVDPEGQVEEVDDTNNQVTQVVLLSSGSDLTDQDGETGSADPDGSAGSGLPGWWWIPVVGVVLAVLAGARAIRAARRTQERDSVRRHLRVRARSDPGHQSISQDPTGRGSHTVRLEPSSGDVQVWVEEVEQR